MNESAHRPAVDLTNCDREPIHVPGAIQPHGVLFALSSPALTVSQVSRNVGERLGLPLDQVLGRSLEDVLGDAPAREVRAALVERRWADLEPLRLVVRGQPHDGIVHEHDGSAILELEPVGGASRELPLRAALSALHAARTVAELFGWMVAEVKRLTGFERVLLYRFDHEGNGSVDHEALDPGLDPYLGLHYPASDIPRQARALYLKNWIRNIPDARYAPAPLVPALRPDTGGPLDLSFSVLRSVSPIHVEYLANIGIRASLSVSIIVQGQLWGLVSCANHSGPRFVAFAVRAALEVLGRFASLHLEALLAHEALASRQGRRETIERLAAAVRSSDPEQDVLASLLRGKEELLRLVGATGAAAVHGATIATCGPCPPPHVVQAIASWLDERAGLAPFSTATLPRLFAGAVDGKDLASGVLTFGLPGLARRRLLWFRPEIIRTVTWGGDPRKPAEVDAARRLHPRRSFEQWKEVVRLSSRPWLSSDLEAADELRRALVEVDLERRVLREQRAVRTRDDLVAVVSHDLRTPLGVIQLQSQLLMREATATPEQTKSSSVLRGGERILHAARRMETLIRGLLDLAKIEAGRFELERRPVRVAELVEEPLGIVMSLAQAKGVSITKGLLDEGLLLADRERMFQVLSNLLGNAVKFTPAGGVITVGAERRGDVVLFSVTDTGPGVPPEQLEHLFERFWAGRPASQKGSGLGLFIAKGVVDAHGGRIWAESTPGAGARFYFTLPAG